MTEAFILFFGALSLAFAVLVLTLRQPMRAALALIAHMFCLAGIFAALGAHVMALLQVLIYVGAVMVFMVYTIMLLDDRDASYRHVYVRILLPALVVTALLAGALLMLLQGDAGLAADGPPAGAAAFGISAFSVAFMRQYWFHFELATVLLLIGIVVAWTVVRESR